MADKSSARPNTDQPVDLSPTNLMRKPLVPNFGMKHAAQTMKGADIQIHYNPKAGLRSKQNAAVRMFIEEQRTVLYLQSRQGTVSEEEYQIRANELKRMQDKMIQSLSDWARDIDPKRGSIGTDSSPEFLRACAEIFGQLKDVLDIQVEIDTVPVGPVSGQASEKQPVAVPVDLKLSDLDVVEQPLNSGPLGEQSVLEVGLQQPDLPVFEPDEVSVPDVESDIPYVEPTVVEGLESEIKTEEDSDVHPVRSDEVGPPEGGDGTV